MQKKATGTDPELQESDVTALASPRPMVIILKAMRPSIRAGAGAMPLSTSGSVGRAWSGSIPWGCIADIVGKGWSPGWWDLPTHARLKAGALGRVKGATGLPLGSRTCPVVVDSLSQALGHAAKTLCGMSPSNIRVPPLLGTPTPRCQPVPVTALDAGQPTHPKEIN